MVLLSRWATMLSLAVAQALTMPPTNAQVAARGEAKQRSLPLDARAADVSTAPMEVFQVASPVLTPMGPVTGDQVVGKPPGDIRSSCQVVLMDHHFANSYGAPFVGRFLVPSKSRAQS